MSRRSLPRKALARAGYALSEDADRVLSECPPGTHPVGHPRTLTWVEVSDDGSECVRVGRVWSECVRVAGLSALWVRADHDGQMWCVVRAHRRVGTGRVRGAKWRPGRGRVMEVGEWFTERHPDAPTGRLSAASRRRVSLPTVIRVDPLPPWVMAQMSEP